MGEFRAGTARVRVPCSSANLGPVFDYAGLALGLYDELEAEIVGDDLDITVHGESADRVPLDRRHMVVRVMDDTWEAMGVTPPAGLRLISRNAIPHGRGLGSSAAAIAAGIVLARALVVDGEQRFVDADVFNLGTRLEGHPDNISASLFGGLTLAWVEFGADDEPLADHVSLHVDESVVPVVVIPGDVLPTKKARAMLPEAVAHKDAAFNAGRSALLIQALTRQPELLLPATADRLHQEQRRSAMPDSLELVDALRSAGIPAVISGAGPCVLAFASELTAPLVAELVGQAHVTRQLPVAYDGALGSVTI